MYVRASVCVFVYFTFISTGVAGGAVGAGAPRRGGEGRNVFGVIYRGKL